MWSPDPHLGLSSTASIHMTSLIRGDVCTFDQPTAQLRDPEQSSSR